MTMALRCLAFACGGEEGVRLADRLGMATSPGTLLRELRRPELPVRARPKAFPLPLFSGLRLADFGHSVCPVTTT